jgi:hypothetical protein
MAVGVQPPMSPLTAIDAPSGDQEGLCPLQGSALPAGVIMDVTRAQTEAFACGEPGLIEARRQRHHRIESSHRHVLRVMQSIARPVMSR